MSFQSFKKAFHINPSDALLVPNGVAKALYIGGPGPTGHGDIKVQLKPKNFVDGSGNDVGNTGPQVTFENVPSGTILPVTVTHVLATGTNAENIIGLL